MTVPMIKSIGDVPYPIDTHSDAFSPLLTAGAALGITGNGPTESAAWLQRVSTSDGPTTIRSIHGRTVRWNQLCNLSVTQNTTGLTVVDNGDGSVTVSGTSSVSEETANITLSVIPRISGHKYLIMGCPTGGSASTYYMGVNTSQTDLGSGGIYTSSSTGNAMLRLEVCANGITFENTVITPQVFDLTAMFGAGNEPSTVAEFEALYPLPYYEYDAGSLLSVNMTGIETTGFNQWDEEWELGSYNTTNGEKAAATTRIRCKNPIPVFPDTDYYLNFGSYSLGSQGLDICFYDANGDFLSFLRKWSASLTTPTGAYYMTWSTQPAYGTTYNHDICINLSWSGRRNGEYEAFWKSQRLIDVASYFPDGMRSAGTVYDELTSTEAITRVGVVDLGTLTWNDPAIPSGGSPDSYPVLMSSAISDIARPQVNTYAASKDCCCALYPSDYTAGQLNTLGEKGIAIQADGRIRVRDSSYSTGADFKAAMNGVMLHYALATPTVAPIDPALNLSYRVDDFGTERIMVPDGTMSSPPTLVTAQGYTAESLRDAALSAIAPVENGKASTNYGVGSYLVHAGQLCKVTTAIATGESITIGTNVTATTVMAEVIALIAQ